MPNILQEILAHKHKEVAQLKQQLEATHGDLSAEKITRGHSHLYQKQFQSALSKAGLSIIGEIKRKSPSKGELAQIADPISLAETYANGGIDAISMLTDKQYFNGSLDDLKTVASRLQQPILRKDFIIDAAQIIETVTTGASAVLLIVAALKEKTASLLSMASDYGLDALVEVHNQQELDTALAAKAKIIGINNRDLTTFNVDLNTSINLIKNMPEDVVKVTESGIRNLDDVQRIKAAGFDAALIGEALVKSDQPDVFIKQIKS
ncbi:MAG: indole-3-glycerol phosphate synthase TrpC [Pseudomonadota bacterium]